MIGKAANTPQRRTAVAPIPPGHGGVPPPTGPPVPIVAPIMDIAIQVRQADAPYCLDDDQRDQFINGVLSAVAPSYPDARAEGVCRQFPHGENDATSIGVWLYGVPAQHDQMLKALHDLDFIKSDEMFAFMFPSAGIRIQAQETFAASAPNIYSSGGELDANGPIHLTGISVEFAPETSSVATVITGFDTTPWPDVPFTLTLTDSLSLKDDAISDVATSKLVADTSWMSAVEVFVTALLGSVWPPLAALSYAFFSVEEVVIATSGAPSNLTGVGHAVAAGLPVQLPIPGGLDLCFAYTRCEVGAGGLLAGGALYTQQRSPKVVIAPGPTAIPQFSGYPPLNVAITRGGFATVALQAVAYDMLRPVSYRWNSDGHLDHVGTGAHDTSTATVTFSASASAGELLTGSVTVDATDADGMTATATMPIALHVISTSPPTDGTSPICWKKPWLCPPAGH
jgi:hypothetical protein